MIKQGVITMNTEFIQARTLSQLSFIQLRPYEISFLRLLWFLMLMPQSKKTLETSLDLIPLFKISLDARSEDIVLNVVYLENWYHEKDMWHAQMLHSLDCKFFF